MTVEKNPSGMPSENLVGDSAEKKDFVAYETYQKTLSQEKAAREKNREYELKFKQIEEERLKNDGEYKKIAELRTEEANKERERANSLEKDIGDTWKLQAFFDKLPGHLKSNEYLTHVDLESIVLDPETKQVEQASIEKVVNTFMEKHSGLVDVRKSSGLPTEAAKPTAKKTLKEMTEQERTAFMKDSLMSSMTNRN